MKEKKLSLKELEHLDKVIKNKNKDYNERTIRRAKAIKMWNYGNGKTYNEIINETGFSRRTLQYLFKNVNEKNIFEINYKKYPKSKLCDAKNLNGKDIIDYFEEKEDRPKTYKDATKIIRREFNVSISESAVRRYLIKKGWIIEKGMLKKKKNNRK